MAYFNDDAIQFVRLSEIALNEIVQHMSDPRLKEHMPLLSGAWDYDTARTFVAGKEACWERDGLGHWAILVDGKYVGWGGFQKEGDEWDFGLVLKVDRFGLGVSIVKRAIAFARADVRIAYVTFLLPPTRRKLGALKRIGAISVGMVEYSGESFLKYRLETSSLGSIEG